jgi:Fe-S-cluster containining protein
MSDSIEERLVALYARLPEITAPCLPGCRECCGPIPMTKTEWRRIKEAHPHAIEPRLLEDGTHIAVREVIVDGERKPRCPFRRDASSKRGCSVYLQRPFVCRLYASTRTMECPYGCAAAVQLTASEHRKLAAEYHRIHTEDR